MRRVRAFLRDLLQLARARSRADPLPYDELLRSEEHYRLLAEGSRDIIWRYEFPDRLTYVSPASEQILGWKPEEQVTRTPHEPMLTPASARLAQQLLAQAVAARRGELIFEAEHLRRDGGSVWCEVHQAIEYGPDGQPQTSIGVTRDITERRDLQQRLLQTQKMEVLGNLAGGVAHEFNNYLAVILGTLEAVSDELGKSEPSSQLLRDAQHAAERASALTAQILGFTRRDAAQLTRLDLNPLVTRAGRLMVRTLGGEIRLETALAGDPVWVRADPVQLEQILFNLVLNARDALDAGGTITVETANVFIDADNAARQPELDEGPHGLLSVSDDGSGMDAATRARAFEPFFSTKGRGEGTGLGLSLAQEMLTRFGGHIALESAPGAGTSARVYLPRAEPAAARPDAAPVAPGKG